VKLQRWVVKAGSNMVCSGGPLLLRSWMQQVSILRRNHRVEVIWVTSGAIASAVDRTDYRKKKRTLPEKQALSAIGQPLVMDLYNIALQTSGLLGAQILLTYDDLASSGRRKNFQNTVETLLKWKVMPILNENDAVATEEIKFGDNDSLSAKVANVVDADRLLILTDVNGLYDSDPRKNPRASLVERVRQISASQLKQVAQSPGSSRGTGGMYSKLKAAQEASKNGIETWLVKGDRPHVLIEVAENDPIGTIIEARK
jgi:glutamate 5-kinase